MTIPFVALTGDSYQRGLTHGRARAEALREFLDDGLTRLNRILPAPVEPTKLPILLDRYAAAINESLPEVANEIRGLAAGAGLTYREAVLLQIRRELLGYTSIAVAGDCTTYAMAGSRSVLAQTVDLNGDLEDQIAVLNSGRSLVLSFGGLLGYLGVNNAGLAIGINLVLGGQWREGVPPYLAVRHLLDTCDGVGEAVELLKSLPLASSRALMLCDREIAGYAEILGDQVRFRTSVQPVHTNHFLDPDFTQYDELNVFARKSSLRRLNACRTALGELPAGAGPEAHLDMLARAPFTIPENGDIRRERTVAAVVALPGRRELHIRPGDPSRSSTEVFSLQ